MMTTMGMVVEIVETTEFDPMTDTSDIVLIWPGPGDINTLYDPKMQKLRWHTEILINHNRKLLGVCLGHQAIAHELGMIVRKMTQPLQGEQVTMDVFGRSGERVWCYNSFAPMHMPWYETLFTEIDIADVMTLRYGNISGFQFHPESIMTQHGYEILREELVRIISHS
jgi:phenazine biosynthesis protein phzE